MCSVCGSVSRDRPAPLSVTSLPSPSSRFLISWWEGHCCKCALLWKTETRMSRLLSRVMNEPPMFIFFVQHDYKLQVANINFCFKCRHPSFEWFIVAALLKEFRRYSRLVMNQHCVNARVMMAGVYNVVLIYDSIYRWLACEDWWVWTRELTTSITSEPMPTSVSLAVSSHNLRLLFTLAV